MVGFWFKLVLLILGGVSATILGLAEVPFPKGYWEGRESWVTGSRVALIAVGLVEPIRSLVTGQLRRRRAARRGLVEDVLHYMLMKIDKETVDERLPWYDIGIHVWEVRGVRALQRLSKVARVRIAGEGRGGVKIRWTRGKGAIGICWETGEGRAFNASKLISYSKEEWQKRTEEQRMGLKWEEAQRTKAYGGIVVMPMFDRRGKFKGCVSVDGPPGSYVTLKKQSVVDIVRDGANTCASSLYGGPR